ncbi:magnetosome protein MamI-2 [Fundidesulfovibrio magnetotacticus]|uniref:Magnetosome protein MamI-2 n=1 Tax=Fundidesulfovibrio magnetotacticus TaxID=2730080 RepID=A0A6V8LR90_9BACT|nr:hypothetical protein [Fundidesulfovibrio magnetotacticus]GFK92286.1 magnetosome protein MamI-2 [Fundidesulfovibrio magnetotacticus]
MRIPHIVCGLLAFAVGLFLTYLWSPLVVGVFKGAVQPIALIIGLLALLSVVFDKTQYKKINLVAAVLLLAVGGYGLYDEWIATKDFCIGFAPVLLVGFGLLAVMHGIRNHK